jgi:hypothetical protein
VELLKTKQQPAVESRGFFRRKKEETTKEQQQEQPEQAEATTSRRSFFNRKKEQVGAEQGQPQPQTELSKKAVSQVNDAVQTTAQVTPQTGPSKEVVVKTSANNNEKKV